MNRFMVFTILLVVYTTGAANGKAIFGQGTQAIVTESLNDIVGVIEPDTPDELFVLDQPISELFYAGDVVEAEQVLYAINIFDVGLYRIDLETGSRTLVGVTNPGPSEIWSAVTADSTNGILYGVATTGFDSYLYRIDTNTGANTLIGEVLGAPFVMAIAVNAAGVLYGHDITLDALVEINKTTGQSTVVGPTGYDELFLNGMDFDDNSGILYVAGYDGNDDVIRTIDTTTGLSSVVGSVTGENIFGVFAVLSNEVDFDVIFINGFE